MAFTLSLRTLHSSLSPGQNPTNDPHIKLVLDHPDTKLFKYSSPRKKKKNIQLQTIQIIKLLQYSSPTSMQATYNKSMHTTGRPTYTLLSPISISRSSSSSSSSSSFSLSLSLSSSSSSSSSS